MAYHRANFQSNLYNGFSWLGLGTSLLTCSVLLTHSSLSLWKILKNCLIRFREKWIQSFEPNIPWRLLWLIIDQLGVFPNIQYYHFNLVIMSLFSKKIPKNFFETILRTKWANFLGPDWGKNCTFWGIF